MLLSCPLCPLLEVTPHEHPSTDCFLPHLFNLHSGSHWLLFVGVEGTQSVTALVTILTLALAILLGGRDGDQAGINYYPHLTFPPCLPIVYRGRSVLPCSPFLSLPPELPASDVFPIDSSRIQCLAFKLQPAGFPTFPFGTLALILAVLPAVYQGVHLHQHTARGYKALPNHPKLMPGWPVFLRSQQIIGVKAQLFCLGVAPCQSQLLCWLRPERCDWAVVCQPPHGFQTKTQPNFCFKTFWRIMLSLLLNYCS